MDQVAKANPDMESIKPTPKRMAALFRRLASSIDTRLTYHEFAKFLQPTDLKPYLARIKNKTKLERKHFEEAKLHSLVSLLQSKEKDKRKPLTAFDSEIMLNKDEDREVKLLPK